MRWLSRLMAKLAGPDRAWHPTGIRVMTPLHYDYAAAKRGAQKARRRRARGTLLPKPRPVREKTPAEVYTFSREAK